MASSVPSLVAGVLESHCVPRGRSWLWLLQLLALLESWLGLKHWSSMGISEGFGFRDLLLAMVNSGTF
jgi:hypothetical protein